jgi:ABC-type branched-subunit amino acid transport system permease subunit
MQRIIGIGLGAVVTYLALVLLDATSGDATPKYGVAVVIGALVSLLWPWVIGFFLLRRAKERRSNQVDKEVDKRLAEERSNQG